MFFWHLFVLPRLRFHRLLWLRYAFAAQRVCPCPMARTCAAYVHNRRCGVAIVRCGRHKTPRASAASHFGLWQRFVRIVRRHTDNNAVSGAAGECVLVDSVAAAQ